MLTFIVSDIFGKTPAFETIAKDLAGDNTDVVMIDPYKGIFQDFENEEKAYACFQKDVGMEKYTDIVFNRISGIKDPLLLTGFSVGASAIWQMLNKKNFNKKSKSMCFYGSQMRNILNVNPVIKTEIFFPVKENHFDIKELKEKLEKKENVKCIQTKYLHGFMNRYSVNFNEKALIEYTQKIKKNSVL